MTRARSAFSAPSEFFWLTCAHPNPTSYLPHFGRRREIPRFKELAQPRTDGERHSIFLRMA